MNLENHFKLYKPFEWCKVTQPFGVNYVDFYQQFGLKGHNGIDFRAQNGKECRSIIKAKVYKLEKNKGYGKAIRLRTSVKVIDNKKVYLEIIYAHLKEFLCREGDNVSAKQVIAQCDNTGIYTTADHLHIGVKPIINGQPSLYNGYGGYVDFSNLFIDKGWDLIPVEKRYMRYYREDNPKWRPYHAYLSEVKVALSLIRQWKRIPSNNEIKACTYGGWDSHSVNNAALAPIWGTLKKDEYLSGKTPPIRL